MDRATGSRISLISKSEIRYEGYLNFIDEKQNTVGLKNVRMHGTEGRKGGNNEIPAGTQMYEFIVFRGADIKDLTVYDDQPPDPAIISATPGKAAAAPAGGKRDPSNPWHQNRDHGVSRGGHGGEGRGHGGEGRGRGGEGRGRGRGGYQDHGRDRDQPQRGGRGRGGAGPAAAGTGGGRGRGFSDRKPAPQSQQGGHQQQATRGPRLEHTGREFAAMEAKDTAEFKEDFDFSKAHGDFHEPGAEKKEVKKAYDKTSSFFDSLSNDVSDRQERARGQAFRDQQKKVDNDTFGTDFVGQHANTRYRRSGRGRGRFGNRR